MGVKRAKEKGEEKTYLEGGTKKKAYRKTSTNKSREKEE